VLETPLPTYWFIWHSVVAYVDNENKLHAFHYTHFITFGRYNSLSPSLFAFYLITLLTMPYLRRQAIVHANLKTLCCDRLSVVMGTHPALDAANCRRRTLSTQLHAQVRSPRMTNRWVDTYYTEARHANTDGFFRSLAASLHHRIYVARYKCSNR